MLHATVRHTGGFSFLGKADSNHFVVMDGSEKIGAEDGAARPKELVLFALGGCTGFDVILILKKRRVAVRGLEIELAAEESPDHPMVFTGVEITYRFEGDDLAVAEIERAIRMSHDKYCSVSAMMRNAFPIGWRALLNGQEVLREGERAARES